ncbi:MAG: right-handed parallel beta-helix repeat-containing protein [Planctomycetes bacterium]|nr:right-handed parallel beta-helix repeat-containing protein [Planctomycetota bacterium]
MITSVTSTQASGSRGLALLTAICGAFEDKLASLIQRDAEKPRQPLLVHRITMHTFGRPCDSFRQALGVVVWSVLCGQLSAASPVEWASQLRSAAGGTIFVSPTGNDQNSGASPEQALKSPLAAVLKAGPGDVVCFDAGTYPPLQIVDKRGTRDQPIVFQSVPGKEREATFSSGRRDAGVGIIVESCEYVEVRNLRVTESQKGIDCWSVSNCVIRGNQLEQLGQEALHVGRKHTYDDTKQFTGPASHHVQLLGNKVNGTGKDKEEYGEGIYIGTGAFLGDDTHDVLLEGNILHDISAEGVELKPGTHDLIVRGNCIFNTHHHYNAAITVAIEGVPAGNGNYLIENNLVWDVKKVEHSVAGIGLGHGNAVLRNNIVWSVQNGAGIRLYQTFKNQQALRVVIDKNTINGGTGESAILVGGGSRELQTSLVPLVQLAGTITNDGSGGSAVALPDFFRGPFAGDADHGDGPGSGYALKVYRGAGADYTKIKKLLDVYWRVPRSRTAK